MLVYNLSPSDRRHILSLQHYFDLSSMCNQQLTRFGNIVAIHGRRLSSPRPLQMAIDARQNDCVELPACGGVRNPRGLVTTLGCTDIMVGLPVGNDAIHLADMMLWGAAAYQHGIPLSTFSSCSFFPFHESLNENQPIHGTYLSLSGSCRPMTVPLNLEQYSVKVKRSDMCSTLLLFSQYSIV